MHHWFYVGHSDKAIVAKQKNDEYGFIERVTVPLMI